MQILEWICKNEDTVAILIAAVSALIAAITAVIAYRANKQSRAQYQESIQPQLSMSLVEYNSWLYLQIKNTGKLPAKSITITLDKITNNGGFDEFIPDALFTGSFELYPEEMVQGKVALQGGNISNAIFPQVQISVSYICEATEKRYFYSRTVTYQSAYDEKVIADVHWNAQGIDKSLSSIARATVRTANYLDGRQVAAFDELNILAHESLKKDLLAAAGKPEQPVMSRTETIEEAARKQRRRADDVQ